MSRFLVAVIALVGVQSVASANDTICAGSKTYYRYLQADSGVMHMPATWLIYATLDDGSTLNYSVNTDALAKYEIDFTEENTVSDQLGGAQVDRIYTAKIAVKDQKGATLAADEVTCRHQQKYLP